MSRPDPAWPSDTPWVRQATQAQMLAAFAGWDAAAQVLLENIPTPSLWALHDLAELPGYVHGRVGLIGDAAHAMLPHQGAGAGQGLEDAWLLARLLADPNVMGKRPGAVLQAYDAVRRPRACQVQRTSFQAGELYELRDPLVQADKALLGKVLAERFDWLWDHDLHEDLAQARELLGLQPLMA